MSGIVCALRGGPASQITIDKAVELAINAELPLYFIYVVNLDFLSHTSSSRIHTISEELQEMGDFILLLAQEKAHALGVEAQGVVRQGKVGEEIVHMCREIEADYLVLGLPKGQGEKDIFTHERILAFSRMIESESGAQVVLVQGEKDE